MVLKLKYKAQSVIIQFMLFFLVGFGIFIGVGRFFRTQSDIFREDVAKTSLNLASSYITSTAISSFTCIECDVVENRILVSNVTAGYFIEFSLNSNGIRAATSPPSKDYNSSMHNLNESLQLSGFIPSIKPINLTFNRNQNKLEIGEIK